MLHYGADSSGSNAHTYVIFYPGLARVLRGNITPSLSDAFATQTVPYSASPSQVRESHMHERR